MEDQRYPKTQRLRRRREFLAVQRTGTKFHFAHLLAFVKPSQGGRRIGITASRKVGDAVRRNRIKRLLREIWRRDRNNLPVGYDIVLVAKRNASEASYVQLRQELLALCRRLQRSGPRERLRREANPQMKRSRQVKRR